MSDTVQKLADFVVDTIYEEFLANAVHSTKDGNMQIGGINQEWIERLDKRDVCTYPCAEVWGAMIISTKRCGLVAVQSGWPVGFLSKKGVYYEYRL